MKIDTDLRLAIKSACAAQPQKNDYQAREEAQQQSIQDFLKKFPKKAQRLQGLRKTAEDADQTAKEARAEMCQKFGLREYSAGWTYSSCGGSKENFVKAGGVLPTKFPENWKYDAVMAQLASMTEKEGMALLKKLGINWA